MYLSSKVEIARKEKLIAAGITIEQLRLMDIKARELDHMTVEQLRLRVDEYHTIPVKFAGCEITGVTEKKKLPEDEWSEIIDNLTKSVSGNICHVCKGEITNKRQIGRCVYADPCGHRLYQGRI